MIQMSTAEKEMQGKMIGMLCTEYERMINAKVIQIDEIHAVLKTIGTVAIFQDRMGCLNNQ